MATARQFLLFRQTKQNNKIPRLGDFLVVGVSCKCPVAGSTLRGTIIQLLIRHTGAGHPPLTTNKKSPDWGILLIHCVVCCRTYLYIQSGGFTAA